jgi:hypothetical protein
MIVMPLGMLFIVNIFGYKTNRNIFQNYVYAQIRPLSSPQDSFIRYPLYVLYILSIISVIYVLVTLKTLPLKGILLGLGQEVLAGLRQEASRNFSGSEYIKNIFALGLTPILSYIAYAYYKMTLKKADLIWFILLFVFSFLILTYNIAKSPFIQYLLGFVFLTVLIKGGVKRKTLIIIALIILAMLVGIYFLLAGTSLSFGVYLITIQVLSEELSFLSLQEHTLVLICSLMCMII